MEGWGGDDEDFGGGGDYDNYREGEDSHAPRQRLPFSVVYPSLVLGSFLATGTLYVVHLLWK